MRSHQSKAAYRRRNYVASRSTFRQCTVEIAAFDAFSAPLADPNATAEFDQVMFGTAPTGHTLRLAAAWSQYIETDPHGASCLGPLAALEQNAHSTKRPSKRSARLPEQRSCW